VLSARLIAAGQPVKLPDSNVVAINQMLDDARQVPPRNQLKVRAAEPALDFLFTICSYAVGPARRQKWTTASTKSVKESKR
jgi:hypothetical protein